MSQAPWLWYNKELLDVPFSPPPRVRWPGHSTRSARSGPDRARPARRAKRSTTASRSPRPGRRGCKYPNEYPIAPAVSRRSAGRHPDRRRPAAVRRRFPDRRHDARAHVSPAGVPRRRTRCSAREAVGDARRLRRPDQDAAESRGDGRSATACSTIPQDRLFKMWYMGGYQMNTCYAVSAGRRHWQKPVLDVVPGTNIVDDTHRDSTTVWLDLVRHRSARALQDGATGATDMLTLYVSLRRHPLDASRHERAAPAIARRFSTTRSASVWVFGLRDDQFTRQISGRYRRYWEAPDVRRRRGTGAAWSRSRGSRPTRATSRATGLALAPELYNLDCVAYESLMLGLFTIWRGESSTREKINEVTVGFSRDGFHWGARTAGRSCPCPRSRAAGTGPTCSRPAAAAWSSATSCTST